jgi:Predicted membrane protein
MNKKRKLLLWFGWLTGIVLVLVTILLLLLSRYINSEPAQKKIREVVTQQLGEHITFQRAYLSVFPRPGLAFSQVVIPISKAADVSVESASVYPQLLPLFIGEVRIAKLKFEAPDITIDIPGKKGRKEKAKPSSFKEKVSDIDSVITSIRSALPGLVCTVDRGKLLIRENKRDGITVQDINAHIALVPKGIEISVMGDISRWGRISAQGEFYMEGNNILISDLSVSTGRSLVSIFSAKLRLEDTPFIEIASGEAVLLLDDIYERRSSLASLYDPLRNVKKLKGAVKLESLKLSGALLHPEEWIIEAAGSVKDVDVDFSSLSGPVKVQRGQFTANKGMVTLKNVYGSIFDSSFAASAVISGSVQAIDSAEVAMNGNIGPETVRWVSKTFNLPPEQTVRAPLSVSDTHIVWQTGSNLAITGNAAVQNGPTVSFDLRKYAGELAIKQLNIRDEDSHAAITVLYGENLVDFSFRGVLTEKALNRMFARTSFHRGSIKGDFRAHIQLDRPGQSSAQGYLEGAHLFLPLGGNEPLQISQANLRAENKTLKVESATVSFGDSDFILKGNVKALERGFRIDMDASADVINMDAISKALAGKKNPAQPLPTKLSGKSSKKNPALQGIVRLKAKSVTWGKYTANPVSANIMLDREGGRVVVIDATHCGISLPGNLRFADGYIQLDFKPKATGEQLEPALNCLWGKDLRISGIVDLKAEVNARGKSEELVRALTGKVDFRAKAGCIYRFPLLAKILSFLNVTELLRGKVPDLNAEGFNYNSIIIKGDLRNGIFVLQEAIIDGTTMQLVGQGEIDISNNKINLTVLVAPFKTVDYLVSKIPLVGYVLKGTLISIPLRITGKLDDPNIIILSPTAIGKGMLGIMTRTLLLPVKIIEPFIPRNKEKKQ